MRTSSKLIEDGVGECRRVVKKCSNSQITPERVFFSLIKSKLVDQVHRWNNVPNCQQQGASRGAAAKVRKGAYHARPRSQTKLLNLKRITGNAKWFTCTPKNVAVPMADVLLMRQCASTNRWHEGQFHWINKIIRPGTIIFKLEAQHVDGHPLWWKNPMLVSGNLQSLVLAAVDLELQNIVVGTETFTMWRVVQTNKEVKFFSITEPIGWHAIPAEPASPFRMLACGVKPGDASLSLLQQGKPLPLFQHAAHNAFHDLDLTDMKKICEFGDIDLSDIDQSSLVEVLISALLSWLPDAADDDIVEILQHRINTSGADSEILQCEDFTALFDKQDQTEVDSFIQSIEKKDKFNEQFRISMRDFNNKAKPDEVKDNLKKTGAEQVKLMREYVRKTLPEFGLGLHFSHLGLNPSEVQVNSMLSKGRICGEMQ